MNLCGRSRFFPSGKSICAVTGLVSFLLTLCLTEGRATEPATTSSVTARALLHAGQNLAEKTHYLEALDLFEEARDLLDAAGQDQSREYADLLFAVAQTKIKGRLYQNFPAAYVKSALPDIQTANKLRERISEIPPQQMADGYYLEGFIHKKFFMRKEHARVCFTKAVSVYPGAVAAKRELSELKAPKPADRGEPKSKPSGP
ncbi:MAG: hypothetical protein FJ118_05725 [Deltaproteobacteria bacterium]|nr:hypothetical protein [Deltaproteobacteria bacterium]